MRLLNIGVVVAAIVSFSCSSLFADIPKMKAGNHYGAGRTVATSHSTKHVQGREYHNATTGETHRRVKIYGKDGSFKGYAKTGRTKGDATTRHYHQ
jgi:hypothetical protein